MKHGRFPSLLALLLAPVVASAQTPWQFRWTKGANHDYQVQYVTQVAEVVEGAKVETSSRLNILKRWTVADVDAKGIATLHLALLSLRNEQKRPNGEVLLFDSKNLDKSTPELRDQMIKHVGRTVAVVRMDTMGRTLEVKEGGTPAKYEMEPPFVAVLPGIAPKPGQAWLRPYTMTLEPPLGAGEKFQASQRFQFLKAEGTLATIALSTEIKDMPPTAADQVPLLQKLSQGEIQFDIAAGRLHGVRLSIDRTIENHQGKGSSYRFQSTYTERIAE